MAFLDLEIKEDSPEKIAAVVGKPTKYFLKADEVNLMADKINNLDSRVSETSDKLLIDNGFVIDDTNFTLFSGTMWILSGSTYANVEEISKPITLASDGLKKQCIVLLNSDNDFYLKYGDEHPTSPPKPTKDNGTIILTDFTVTDSTVEEPTAPIIGNPYVEKNSLNPRDINSTGNINLEFNEHSTIRLSGTITNVVGWDFEPTEFEIFQGQDVTVVNDQLTSITYKNNHIDGVKKIRTIDGFDFVLKSGESFKGKFFLEEAVWILKQIGVLQLPKEIYEYTNLAALPISGQSENIYVTKDTNYLYRWNGTTYIQIGGSSTTPKKKQVFIYQRNWTTTTLGRVYYISHNDNAIEFVPGATLHTVDESLTGRNAGMFVAPYNCKIVNVIMTEHGSGSYTGKLGIASGNPNYGGTWNLGYSNKVVHLDAAISATGYEMHKNEFPIVGGSTILKGYKICPSLFFTAQAQVGKTGVTIEIEIEEV